MLITNPKGDIHELRDEYYVHLMDCLYLLKHIFCEYFIFGMTGYKLND